MFRIYSYQVGYVFSHLCFFKDFFWHRHLYLAVDRQERKGDVTCSKGPPAGIQTGVGCVYGMRSNHSTTCAPPIAVCLLVCQQDYTKTTERFSMKLGWGMSLSPE